MKKFSPLFIDKKLAFFLLLQLIAFCSFAQDSIAATGSLAGGGAWYGETWMWMSGAAVSVLLIISLIRWNTNKRTKKD